jgi:hypothetical protein
MLAEHCKDLKWQGFLSTFIASIFLSAAFTKFIIWHEEKTIIKDVKADELEWRDILKKFENEGKHTNSVECTVCCEAKANVILSPCNHLVFCVYCLLVYKRHAEKTYQKLLCPLCR